MVKVLTCMVLAVTVCGCFAWGVCGGMHGVFGACRVWGMVSLPPPILASIPPFLVVCGLGVWGLGMPVVGGVRACGVWDAWCGV